jgi:dynamin 1-like protein
MKSYFNVVKKNINDSVPKTIVTFLINECKNSCEMVLVSNLYKEGEYDDLLS